MTSTEPAGEWPPLADPGELAARLAGVGYLAGDGLAAAAFLALRMGRPLFLEGDPGVGKTAFAQKLAEALDAEPIRLQCYGGLDASQALYDWNFPRQILTLRAAGSGPAAPALVPELYSEEFLIRRPILRAFSGRRAVLLIDEIDRADDEFEALLLEVLENGEVTIPELGPARRTGVRPLVVLTSNQTREVHDALKRRCLYHWIDHPDAEREVAILHRWVAGLDDGLAREIAEGMRRLRAARDLRKMPGVAESIDFATALSGAGATTLTPESIEPALSTVVKHHEDEDEIRSMLLPPGEEQR
jgi:MoxR-like ATPase